MLQVRFLGQFDIRIDGKRILLSTRPAQSLFAYLILTAGTAHRREKLAGLLWPDVSDENARKNLRQELWRIRKAIPAQSGAGHDYLLGEEFTLTFNREANYWLDAAQLARPDLDTQSLAATLSLYQGELLPGFYDEWILLERERVQTQFESKMDQLLEHLVAEERWLTAQEWGERWLALGDAPEAAYRALMIAYGARGDMAKVAAIYQDCITELRDHLDVEPSAETRALYEGLRKGSKGPLHAVTAQPSGTVTFFFTDIEGSTRLLDRLGSQYASLLAEHHQILRAAVQKWNGREVDTQGDAFFVTFARALDAVQCAVEAQRALAAHEWAQGEHVRVRMGLHTGEPLIASTGYVGMDVHRAARIGDAGNGGQVLLSQTTRELIAHDLPPNVTLRELGEHRLKDLKYPTPIYQLVIDGLPADFPPLRTKFAGTEGPTPGEPPFKGLQYFDESDSALFFGREVLTAKLMERLRSAQFLSVIIGASGSGKSSLVRAGLIPAWKQANAAWSVHVITPTAHPLETLATELTRDSESVTATATLIDDLAKDPRSLHLYLSRQTSAQAAPASTATLLVIDQFEELFTLCRDEFEREAFIDNLLAAIAPSPTSTSAGSITLILTLRADFYAHLAQYPELRDAVARQQEYIGPMTADELRRAIEEPAKRGHWEFEPGLVDLILRDVGDEPGALPLLSHALLETWKRRAGYTLTLKGYADAGGVRGAIAHTAAGVYQNLSPEEQTIARNIFLRLTELGEGTEDTRRRASFAELLSQAEDADEVRAVLNTLAGARLITLSEETAEVAHEALIREWPALREWLNQDREGLRLHRQLTEAAQDWEILGRDPGAVYRGARLSQAHEWAALHPTALNAQEQSFLSASLAVEQQEKDDREQQQRRELEAARKLAETESRAAKQLRRRAVFLAGAFVLALVLAGFALYLGNQSNQNALAALSAQAAAQANADAAQKSKVEANAQRDAAVKSQTEAVTQQRIATSRELAAAALGNLNVDPERSLLLALQAVSTTYSADRSVLPQAEDALHRAVLTSRALLTLCCHADSLVTAAYSPDGSRLATASQDGTAKLWDATTGQELMTFGEVNEADAVNALAYSPDGTRIVTGHDDHTSKVWDVATGRVILTLSGHSDYVNGVGYSPDGKHIATASGDGTVKMWDAATGKELYTLSAADPADFVSFIDFNPDGKRFTTTGGDNMLRIRDVATGREIIKISGNNQAINSGAFSPDGTRLATVNDDNTAKVWDVETGALQLSFNLPSTGLGIAFSPDGKWLATSGFDGTAIVWDALSGKQLLTLNGHSSAIYAVSFSPDGTRLATASRDTSAKVWDLMASHELLAFKVTATNGPVLAVAYSPDGTRLATAGTDQAAKVWDVSSGTQLLTLSGHSANVNAVIFSHDGSRLATASDDMTAKVWDAATGQVLLTLSGHTGKIARVAFSSDGLRLATASDDGTARIWDLNTGQTLLTLTGHKHVTAVAFSLDGKYLATTGNRDPSHADLRTILWDAATGQQLTALASPGRMPLAVAFRPDGKQLTVGYIDGGVNVYALSTGAVNAIKLFALRGHSGRINDLAYSPDGKRLATVSEDSTTKIWDTATGQELLSLPGQAIGVHSVTFSPDGTHLAAGNGHGLVQIYLLRIEDLVALARTRLTRTWTLAECQKYLHAEQCPAGP